MSRPKELNFFVAELNWELGADWYREPLRPRGARSAARPRRTTPTCPRFEGVAERMRETLGADARLSTWSATRSTACSRTTCTTSAAATRRGALAEARRRPASSAYVAARPLRDAARALPGGVRPRADPGRLPRGARRASATRRFGGCSSSAASTPGFTSPQFEREWETGSGKGVGRLPADGPRRAPARPAGARPQLRPPAGVGCAGWSSGSSTTRARAGAEARAARGRRERLTAIFARTSRGSRSSPGGLRLALGSQRGTSAGPRQRHGRGRLRAAPHLLGALEGDRK